MTTILGIESSCDETAAAVVTDEMRVLSNVVASQIPVHARYGGVVPELASRNHITAIEPVISKALAEANLTLDDLDGVAVTVGPGLAGCLLIGLQTAKGLAWARGKPLIPINHILAHMHAIYLRDDEGAGLETPDYPHIALAVSGGHTSLYRVDGPDQARMLGQTLDDAAGEAFDKIAKIMGLPYPGGVHIDRMAQEGQRDAIKLPRPMKGKGLDFSFSGLKTAARYYMEAHHLRDDAVVFDTPAEAANLAASVQEAIVDVLVTKTLRACRQENLQEIVIAGGVACNSRLRERVTQVATSAGMRAYLVPGRYCTDNAAMVAGLGRTMIGEGQAVEGRALLKVDVHTTRRPLL